MWWRWNRHSLGERGEKLINYASFKVKIKKNYFKTSFFLNHTSLLYFMSDLWYNLRLKRNTSDYGSWGNHSHAVSPTGSYSHLCLFADITYRGCQASAFPQGIRHLFLLLFACWFYCFGSHAKHWLLVTFFMTTEKTLSRKLSILIHHYIIRNHSSHGPHLIHSPAFMQDYIKKKKMQPKIYWIFNSF